MEHAHTITVRLAASTLLVGLAATLAGCATPAGSTAGEQARVAGPARVSTEAHLEMSRASADLYVAGLVARARARASAGSDTHREQLQEQVQSYVDDLVRKSRAAREAAGTTDE